jgi:hypothetical protein
VILLKRSPFVLFYQARVLLLPRCVVQPGSSLFPSPPPNPPPLAGEGWEGARGAKRRKALVRNAAPRGPPRGRADLRIAGDHRPITLAGAPSGAPPRHLRDAKCESASPVPGRASGCVPPLLPLAFPDRSPVAAGSRKQRTPRPAGSLQSGRSAARAEPRNRPSARLSESRARGGRTGRLSPSFPPRKRGRFREGATGTKGKVLCRISGPFPRFVPPWLASRKRPSADEAAFLCIFS